MVPITLYFVAFAFCLATACEDEETHFCGSNVKNAAIRKLNNIIDVLDSSNSYPKNRYAGRNLAKRKRTGQKDTTHGGVSGRAVDGRFNPVWGGRSCTHTSNTNNPYWWVDLGGHFVVTSVWIQNRADCCHQRLSGAEILVGNNLNQGISVCAKQTSAIAAGEVAGFDCRPNTRGRFVKVQLRGKKILTLCEVAVFGYPAYWFLQ